MRIIAGKYKGLKLEEFNADNIRPTLDRAREGIFSKLQFDIKDSKVLDLFAGTGAISLEFLSRGASLVVTCDNNKNSINLIKSNFKKAKESPNLFIGDYIDTLDNLKNQKFDIIFLDPPFKSEFGLSAIRYIFEHNMIENDGVVVFEHSSEDNFDFLDINCKSIDTKKYGYITVDYLVKRDD